jgi:hypothetical protein
MKVFNRLPALAARRINRRHKLDLRPSQFIVIGDTPNDIACAKHFGARRRRRHRPLLQSGPITSTRA